jgi:hypothetical protein
MIDEVAMSDEEKLIDQLRAIEAAFAGVTADDQVESERGGGDPVRTKILARMAELEKRDPPEEIQLSSSDIWSNRVLLALLRRYGLTPYRYPRQRATTVMVMVSPSFAQEILVPAYERIADALFRHLHVVTHRIVTNVLGSHGLDEVPVKAPPDPRG